jgi:alkyl hydroperoxide reductase subunit AhpC
VATLMLATRNAFDGAQRTLTSPSLRTWLREGWAILFSHPDDFVRYDLEMDRWLVVTRRAFADRWIRPIALASPTLDVERSWVTQVSDDKRIVMLEDPAQHNFGPVDLQAPALREEIEQPGRRFVMIIDSALRKQKIFTYHDHSNLPSPLEFLGWADALRAKQTAATETNSRFVPDVHSHHYFAARRHKHRAPQLACTPAIQARPAIRARVG